MRMKDCRKDASMTGISEYSPLIARSYVLYMFQIAINKLFQCAVLASHRGSSGAIPGRDMSVLGSLVQDGDDLRKVSSKSLHSGDPNVICPIRQ